MASLPTTPADRYSHAAVFQSMAGTFVVSCPEYCGTVAVGIHGGSAAMDALALHNRTAHGNVCGCSWICGTDDH